MTPRVLILTPYFYPLIGGVESNADRFAQYLASHGLGVHVLTKRLSTALPDTERRNGVTIQRVGPHGDRSAGGKWRMLPAVINWLVRHRAEYDVVCVIDYRGVGIAAIAARAVTGKRVLIQGQTTGILSGRVTAEAPPEALPSRIAKWPLRRIYVRADALACISHTLEQEAREFGVPESRIHWLPNGIDMTRFQPLPPDERREARARLGFRHTDVVCVFVGRLSREKGISELVAAWHEASPSGATLLVAGPDMPGSPWDCGPSSRQYVNEHGLQQSVRFLGPSDNVASLLQVADIAIQPSHFEALGLSAIEALACGVPVIASNVGGLPEFVADNVNGRLVPAKNVPALAAALRDLTSDTGARTRLAAAARSSVADYDIRQVFARMTALLASLASPR